MDTKILIADDDPIVHESLKIYLEAEGFKTVDCYDGISAVAAADSTVSLCVLDIMTPGKSANIRPMRVRVPQTEGGACGIRGRMRIFGKTKTDGQYI